MFVIISNISMKLFSILPHMITHIIANCDFGGRLMGIRSDSDPINEKRGNVHIPDK